MSESVGQSAPALYCSLPCCSLWLRRCSVRPRRGPSPSRPTNQNAGQSTGRSTQPSMRQYTRRPGTILTLNWIVGLPWTGSLVTLGRVTLGSIMLVELPPQPACSVSYEESCETVYRTEYKTEYRSKCVTAYEAVCKPAYRTEYRQECTTEYETECATSYKTEYQQKCSGPLTQNWTKMDQSTEVFFCGFF